MFRSETIRNECGTVIGYLDENDTDVTARNAYGTIVGRYIKSLNITQDAYGRLLSWGNTVLQTIYRQ